MGNRLDLRRDRQRACVTVVVLAVAVFGIYGRFLGAPLIYDDYPGIVNNVSLRRLWPLFGTAGVAGPLLPPGGQPTERRPFSNLTLAINYHFGGTDPAGYHLVNVVLHILTATMLAALIRQTLRLPYFDGQWNEHGGLLALAITLVWAVHPLHTGAVIVAIQRSELLASFLYVMTMWTALRYWGATAPAPRRLWFTVAIGSSLAAMTSKEIAASLPLAALFYERTFLATSWRQVRRSWPLVILMTPGWGLIGMMLWANRDSARSAFATSRYVLPFSTWWVTQTKVLLLYLKLAIWPWPLSVHYAPTYLQTFDAAWPWLLAFALQTTATTAVVWRRPAARFVLVVMAMILAPSTLVPVFRMMVAEQRVYLALAGLITLGVLTGYRAILAYAPVHGDRLAAGAVVLLVLIFGSVTTRRLSAYEDHVTLWQDNVRDQPDDATAHYNLALVLITDKRTPEAMHSLEETLRLDPEHQGALNNMGMLLEQHVGAHPEDVAAVNLLGEIMVKLNHPREAVAQFERALEIEPANAVTHSNMGTALAVLGRTGEAIDQFDTSLQLQPDHLKTHYNFGVLLLGAGRPSAAIEHFQYIIRHDPDDALTRLKCAIAYALSNDREQALAMAEAGLSVAQARQQDALANEIRAWLVDQRSRPTA